MKATGVLLATLVLLAPSPAAAGSGPAHQATEEPLARTRTAAWPDDLHARKRIHPVPADRAPARVQELDQFDAEAQDAVSGKEFSVTVSFNGNLCWEFATNGTIVIDGETVGLYKESAGRRGIFGFWNGHTDRFANPGTGGEIWFGVQAFGAVVFGIAVPVVPILNQEHLSWSMSGSVGCAAPPSR